MVLVVFPAAPVPVAKAIREVFITVSCFVTAASCILLQEESLQAEALEAIKEEIESKAMHQDTF